LNCCYYKNACASTAARPKRPRVARQSTIDNRQRPPPAIAVLAVKVKPLRASLTRTLTAYARRRPLVCKSHC